MMPRTFEHGVPETVHLTEQNVDEALIANEGIGMAVEIPRDLADSEQGVTLRNGASVRVRAIRPDDEPRLMALCRRLSPRAVYQRFFSFRRLLPEEAHALANVDDRRRMAVVAEVDDGQQPELIGVARYGPSNEGTTADIGLVVADGWPGLGLGSLPLEGILRARASPGDAATTRPYGAHSGGRVHDPRHGGRRHQEPRSRRSRPLLREVVRHGACRSGAGAADGPGHGRGHPPEWYRQRRSDRLRRGLWRGALRRRLHRAPARQSRCGRSYRRRRPDRLRRAERRDDRTRSADRQRIRAEPHSSRGLD